MTTRRRMLGGAGAATLFAASGLEGGVSITNPGRIDFHHHFVPDIYRDTLAKAGITTIGRVPFPDWNVTTMLERMDRLRVDRALLSISAPGVDFGDARLATDLATRTNDHLRELGSRNRRISGLATLPLPDAAASVKELQRLRGSQLAGVILLTSYRGKYLTDPAFAPVLEALNDSDALVLLHPGLPAGAEQLGLTLPPPILEFVFDTTRCVAEMIFVGTLDRYPRIRWVVSHLGGTLPYVAWRLSMIEQNPRGAYAGFRARGKSVADYLRGLHYDTAVSAGPASLKAALELVGPSRLVFGSDIPFLPMNFAEATTASLDSHPGLSAAEHDAINFGNAAGLLDRPL